MKHKIIIKMLIIVASIGLASRNSSFAQEEQMTTTIIKGVVLDETASPMKNVEVKAFLSKDFSHTNDKGAFEIEVATNRTDMLTIDHPGYYLKVLSVSNGDLTDAEVRLRKIHFYEGEYKTDLPFRELETSRTASSIYTVTGEQLESYPSASFIDALSGLMPGVVISPWSSEPGTEEYASSASVRGMGATIYVDGVIRDPSDLIASEVEKVEVLKDLSARASLGIYGSGPVIWITTRKGESYNREIGFSAEYGMNMATAIPEYVDAFDYANLYNEALVNDGMEPYYTQEALDAYKNNSNPVRYPNIDYRGRYVRPSSPFKKAHISFAGGDDKVNFFSMISYLGTEGLEAIGEKKTSDRLKLRGNVNIKLNDIISMNVNISGMYKGGRSPHQNIFSLISEIPANAHPIDFNDSLIISNDYPINIENEMVYRGFEEQSLLSTQNNATLFFDLSDFIEGLSARASAAFDVTSNIVNGKYESAPLYRLVQSVSGADSIELVSAQVRSQDMSVLSNNILRKTVLTASANYNRTFGKHAVVANLSYYQGQFETNAYTDYQPEKMQDLALNAAYTFDGKYTVQIDQVLSGSMRMPKGKRFSLYPSIGLGWMISNEAFLKDSKAVDFLKLNASFGIMGVNAFNLGNYNTYYLYETLWEQSGSWLSGITGKFATPLNGYIIKQAASDNYTVPKVRNLDLALQGSLFKR
ncbi:MAG TPA: TonB-dependent receptor plug domain-containing protein, partial [Prolixibacteraceae bacterium]|nr:TonB-dependent receptor plug domain-containing protein [Prolixibacteraceae bacterium]